VEPRKSYTTVLVVTGTTTPTQRVNHLRLDISVAQQQINYLLDTGPAKIYGEVKADQLRVHRKQNKVNTNNMAKKINYDSIPMNNKDIDRVSKRVSENFQFPKSDMEATITASTQTVKRGGGAPTPGSANVDKVVERKSKREFGDVALSPKEKQGAKGAKWAKSREFSKQKVTFKK